MSPMNITIISLVGVGVVAIIIALIWTKLIKPNTFGYSNKNMHTKHEYDVLVKKIQSSTKVWDYKNANFNFDNQTITFIEKMFVTTQGVYLLSNPLEEKIINVFKKSNEIKVVYKNNKELDLPLDVNLMIANGKILKQFSSQNNINLIVPVSNESFINKQINNIDFVQKKELDDFILSLENKESSFRTNEFIEFINKYKMPSRKRGIFKPKSN